MRLSSVVVFGVFALAACASQDRVALELVGDFPTVRQVDLILAAPQAYPRGQRANAASPAVSWSMAMTNETVHYVAQRGEATAVMLGANETVDSFRIQLASDDGASYLPIVIARDEAGGIVAVGVYDADAVFGVQDDGGATPEISQDADKLKIYKIQLEAAMPVAYEGSAPSVPTRGVMEVPCRGAVSGLVWRRSAKQQLRILLPIADGTDNAESRATSPNLDCDEHTAGIDGRDRHGGDRLDCDDTVDTTSSDAPELCNGVDDNCDGIPGMVVRDNCANSCAPAGVGLCDETQAAFATKCAKTVCSRCDVPTMTVDTLKSVCSSSVHLLPQECVNQKCRLTLAHVDAPWTVMIGTANPLTAGVNQPVDIDNVGNPTGNLTLLAVEAASASMFSVDAGLSGQFILSVQVLTPTVQAPIAYHYALKLGAPNAACAESMACGN